jgi:hypothetical protein
LLPRLANPREVIEANLERQREGTKERSFARKDVGYVLCAIPMIKPTIVSTMARSPYSLSRFRKHASTLNSAGLNKHSGNMVGVG